MASPPTAVVPALLTPQQVAVYLQISPRTVRALKSSGRFPPAVRIGNRLIRYRRKDVDAWVDEQTEAVRA